MPYVEDENGNHIFESDGNKINFSVSFEVDTDQLMSIVNRYISMTIITLTLKTETL